MPSLAVSHTEAERISRARWWIAQWVLETFQSVLVVVVKVVGEKAIVIVDVFGIMSACIWTHGCRFILAVRWAAAGSWRPFPKSAWATGCACSWLCWLCRQDVFGNFVAECRVCGVFMHMFAVSMQTVAECQRLDPCMRRMCNRSRHQKQFRSDARRKTDRQSVCGRVLKCFPYAHA